MKILNRLLSHKSPTENAKPLFFNLAREGDLSSFEKLIKQGNIKFLRDTYTEQKQEYLEIKHPAWTKDRIKEFTIRNNKKKPEWQEGRWVFYPWLATAVHLLEEKKFFQVRTARNKHLISEKEQEKLYRAKVGIAGLSIGNSIAQTLTLIGGVKYMRLADNDTLALSNTNRIRAGLSNLGLPKTLITARQIYELNPYAKIELFPQGLSSKNISRFFQGPPPLDIIIDEVDNLAVKYLIRTLAQKIKIPVVMGADVEHNALIDIERYDQQKNLSFFHGRLGKITYSQLAQLNRLETGKYITKHVGSQNISEKMRESLAAIGKTIPTWPQLGTAALINGAAVAYCVIKILNRQPIINNRAIISLDKKLTPP